METTAKEWCQQYVEKFTEEQCADLLFVIELANYTKDKGDIMRFTEYYEKVDSAKPQAWSDKMRNEMRADPMWYAWSYKEHSVWGQPVHLLEKLFEKLIKSLCV